MCSVNHVVTHHILSEVSLNELLVCVPIESAARFSDLFSMVDDPRLHHIFGEHFLNSLVELREVKRIVLFKSALGIGQTSFNLFFFLVYTLFEEFTSFV